MLIHMLIYMKSILYLNYTQNVLHTPYSFLKMKTVLLQRMVYKVRMAKISFFTTVRVIPYSLSMDIHRVPVMQKKVI